MKILKYKYAAFGLEDNRPPLEAGPCYVATISIVRRSGGTGRIWRLRSKKWDWGAERGGEIELKSFREFSNNFASPRFRVIKGIPEAGLLSFSRVWKGKIVFVDGIRETAVELFGLIFASLMCIDRFVFRLFWWKYGREMCVYK